MVHKFPEKIKAWSTRDGRYEFQPSDQSLFPPGQEHEYVNADCIRSAALLFRNPDNFSILLEALEGSCSDTDAGKLDDALKFVAGAFRGEVLEGE